jgi:hypothetical protein
MSRNLTVHFKRVTYLVEPGPDTLFLGRERVGVHEWDDGRVEIHAEGRPLPYSIFDQNPHVTQGAIVENKRLGAVLAVIQTAQTERDRVRLTSKKLTIRQKDRIRATGKVSPQRHLRQRPGPWPPSFSSSPRTKTNAGRPLISGRSGGARADSSPPVADISTWPEADILLSLDMTQSDNGFERPARRSTYPCVARSGSPDFRSIRRKNLT